MYRSAIAYSAILVLLGSVGTARAGDAPQGGLQHRFYTDWELLYVERDKTPDVEVGFNDIGVFREVLSTDAVVDDDEEFGGRAVLGFRLDDKSAVEAVYMGWGHASSATEWDDGDLFAFQFPDSAFDSAFDAAEVFDLEYDEDFYSGELNFRRVIEVDGADYRLNLLAGIRAIRLEEDLDFVSFDSNPPPVPSEIGTYHISTRNTLIGAQLGFEAIVPLWQDVLELDLYAVGGGFANQAKVYADFSDLQSAGGPERESRSQWQGTGVFEFAATTKIQVHERVALKFGYRALILMNVATAPDNFARSGSPSDLLGDLRDNDDTIFHGPSAGFIVAF